MRNLTGILTKFYLYFPFSLLHFLRCSGILFSGEAQNTNLCIGRPHRGDQGSLFHSPAGPGLFLFWAMLCAPLSGFQLLQQLGQPAHGQATEQEHHPRAIQRDTPHENDPFA